MKVKAKRVQPNTKWLPKMEATLRTFMSVPGRTVREASEELWDKHGVKLALTTIKHYMAKLDIKHLGGLENVNTSSVLGQEARYKVINRRKVAPTCIWAGCGRPTKHADPFCEEHRTRGSIIK